jgi:hypothetical protein
MAPVDGTAVAEALSDNLIASDRYFNYKQLRRGIAYVQ